jgi:hypothetical protein
MASRPIFLDPMSLDDATKFGVGEIPQEKGGPDDPAQFLEGWIAAVIFP